MSDLQREVTGQNGDDGIPLQDLTQAIRDSTNSDSINLFDPEFLGNLVYSLKPFADNYFDEFVEIYGDGTVDLGTIDNPKLTVALDDFEISGPVTGAGILIVRGILDIDDGFEYKGLVMVVGYGELEADSLANVDIEGSLFVATVMKNDLDKFEFGNPWIRMQYDADVYYNEEYMQTALNLMPYKILSWREIAAEIDN